MPSGSDGRYTYLVELQRRYVTWNWHQLLTRFSFSLSLFGQWRCLHVAPTNTEESFSSWKQTCFCSLRTFTKCLVIQPRLWLVRVCANGYLIASPLALPPFGFLRSPVLKSFTWNKIKIYCRHTFHKSVHRPFGTPGIYPYGRHSKCLKRSNRI